MSRTVDSIEEDPSAEKNGYYLLKWDELQRRGDAEALFEQGRRLRKSVGIPKDEDLGWEYTYQAALLGHPASLGTCFFYGKYAEKDISRAVALFTASANRGNVVCKCTCVSACLCVHVTPSAQYNLAVCYAGGQGVEHDQQRAVELYSKSAEAGFASSQCNLGVIYERGLGVQRDMKKAIEFYKRSAVQNASQAQYNLALYYRDQAPKRNRLLAAYWLFRAQQNGDADGQNAITRLRVSAAESDRRIVAGLCHANCQVNERIEALEWLCMQACDVDVLVSSRAFAQTQLKRAHVCRCAIVNCISKLLKL